MQNFRQINWNDLRVILPLARYGSVKQAAKSLQTTESTISRRLQRVEEQLDLTLFDRTVSGVQMTAVCARFFEHLEQAESALHAGLETVGDAADQAAGVVRITSVPMLVNHLLIPSLGQLAETAPRLYVEFVASPADLSLVRREVDIALRLARPKDDLSAITKRIGSLQYGVFVGDSVARQATNQNLIPWIGYEGGMHHLPQAKWIAERVSRSHEPLAMTSFNDGDSIVAALRAGLGKSLLPVPIGRRYPDLQELPGPEDLPIRELWVLFHSDFKDSRRVRVIVEWLATVIGGTD